MCKKNKAISFLLFCLFGAMLFYSQLNAQEAKDNDVDKNQNQEESTSEEPQKAVTESGENVILSPDGTWEYALDESKDEVQRTVNSTKFVTPALSKDSVKGRVVNYEINYDKEKWQILAKNINETAEYSLLHKDNNAYAIVIPENATIPLEALRNIVIKNARSVSGKVKILKEEERNVNGSKVIMLNMKAKVQGMDFIYLYYIYSGEKATIQVIGFTTEELFSEYQNDLENLLNGLVVKKGENPVKP